MGSPTSRQAEQRTRPSTSVTLSEHLLDKYEVYSSSIRSGDDGKYKRFEYDPHLYSGNPNRPVEKVSWNDAQVFLARLNAVEQTAGRLPNGWAWFCPPSRNGNTLVGQARTRLFLGSYNRATNANYTDSGIGQTVEVDNTLPIHGAFTTCTETFGNGRRLERDLPGRSGAK